MKNSLLVVPYLFDKTYKRELENREYLAFQYLYPHILQKGIKCEIINAHAKLINNQELVKIIMKEDYEFIGISCHSQRSYPFVKELVSMLRENNYKKHICLGGLYLSLAYNNILDDNIDINTMLLGEGEYTLPELILRVFNNRPYDDIQGIVYRQVNGSIFMVPSTRINNLDNLLFPSRDLSLLDDFAMIGGDLQFGKYFRMLAGRGCYGGCSFCSIANFYKPQGKVYRSPQNVVNEIEYLLKTYNINHFEFNDEILYDSSPKGIAWVEDFSTEIINRGLDIQFAIELRADDIKDKEIKLLKKAGLVRVSFGAESGIQRVLNEMNKHIIVETTKDALKILENNDVIAAFTFIAIIPTMTFEELKENYEFLFSLNDFKEENVYNQLNVYSGTRYEKFLESEGLLIQNSVFYERHGYRFLDTRVEVFNNCIQAVRNCLAQYKKEMVLRKSETQNISSFSLQYKNFVKYNKDIWQDIVWEVVNFVETLSLPLSNDSLNSRINDYAINTLNKHKEGFNKIIMMM